MTIIVHGASCEKLTRTFQIVDEKVQTKTALNGTDSLNKVFSDEFSPETDLLDTEQKPLRAITYLRYW